MTIWSVELTRHVTVIETTTAEVEADTLQEAEEAGEKIAGSPALEWTQGSVVSHSDVTVTAEEIVSGDEKL